MNGFRRTIGAGSTLALLVGGLVFASPAQAVHVTCGQTITTNTVLDSDVGPCPTTGIRIGASNITLDLNGHRVFGAPGNGSVSNPQIGIETVGLNGQSGVTIRNGTVTEFDTGIFLFSGGNNTITEMNLYRNQGRLGLIWGEGIQTYLSDDNKIVRNRIVDNGPFDGVVIFDGSRNLIDSNIIQGNKMMVPSANAQRTIGVWISFIGDEPTADNVISNNTIDDNGLDGIQVAGGTTGTRILNNMVTRNGLTGGSFRDGNGIAANGIFMVVTDNLVQGNGQNGIWTAAGSALVGRNNTIMRNRAFGNNAGPNPGLDFDLRDDNANCDANVWQANQFGTRNQACIN